MAKTPDNATEYLKTLLGKIVFHEYIRLLNLFF